ncbi:MAG: hypothetical protein JKY15_01790 [Deltaproteobacteria bacterium]|nr:hypothetical protein [Deltaproteobacteria bacterium]
MQEITKQIWNLVEALSLFKPQNLTEEEQNSFSEALFEIDMQRDANIKRMDRHDSSDRE